ncbi:SAV_915 family protein [Saccharopolyspora sp. NPDC050642]|uniref:SAV_915 family protein n=1 Tax=Saccharopolyspora sp. NPDC050642 TaxID=3157099 RepID=UPI0033C2725F
MSFSRTDSNRPQVAPPVLGPEYSGQESGDGPERLHVPVQRVAADRSEAGVALRRLPDGRLALLVYSSAELLAECCGEHQSWIAIRTGDLHEVRHRCAADLVIWDAPLPAELRERGAA